MEKNLYEAPTMEIIKLEIEDVMLESDMGATDDELFGLGLN